MSAPGDLRGTLDLVAPLAADPPAAAPLPRALLPAGTDWDGWLVEEPVGHGAMGQVYRARHPDHGLGALKIMAADGLADPEARTRFANEARLAALVQAPQVVRVLASGVRQGHPWLAMELVEGRSLAEDLRSASRPPPPPTAAGFALQAARGLAAAHACGLVHRDIKPANLLLDGDDALKIADFGLARLAGASTLTRTGTVLGTPQYLSPEQGRGLEADHRGDLYSLGCVLFELLTLRPPFISGSVEALIFQHNYAEPPLPTALNPDVPADLQAVCLKCLQKDPARRYADAATLVEDLERVAAGLAPRSAVFAPGRLATGADEALRAHAGWRRRWWPLAATLAALAAAGALGWWWWDARKAESAQVRARLAPLARAASAPATAEADLARLARLAGGDDPQVQQGRARLAELAAVRQALVPLEGRCAEPAARTEAAALVGRLAALTGGEDPALRPWLERLTAVESEVLQLRAALGRLDAGLPDAAERRVARPRLERLAALAGADDAGVRRWNEALAAGAEQEEALRRRCGRLDDPAPLTAAALDDLAACHQRLARLDPAAAQPAGWAVRLERERERLAALRERLARALAADPGDGRATAEAEQAAQALAEREALDPADAQRLERRQQAEQERRAAALAERAALAARCAVLDAPR
ncbi:MAG: serine/threonine protein kinase, partial [Planctomycetes bacterium]|nr:serine/threonine protein kinase [Planctomycetota bacterium]